LAHWHSRHGSPTIYGASRYHNCCIDGGNQSGIFWVLPRISLQSTSQSVHTNFGSDRHVVNFASDKLWAGWNGWHGTGGEWNWRVGPIVVQVERGGIRLIPTVEVRVPCQISQCGNCDGQSGTGEVSRRLHMIAQNYYSGVSVHERLSSRTNRFTNKFSEKKVSGDERCLE
jgi:hypothetical protein